MPFMLHISDVALTEVYQSSYYCTVVFTVGIFMYIELLIYMLVECILFAFLPVCCAYISQMFVEEEG